MGLHNFIVITNVNHRGTARVNHSIIEWLNSVFGRHFRFLAG